MSKIKAHLIIEIMGRPIEHVKEMLNTLIVRMGSEKGVEVLDKKYHEPKPVQKAENLFMSFAEVNVEFETLPRLFSIISGYMPSNIEVYEPERFKLNAHEINELSNFIIGKLHKYDEVTKRIIFERDALVRQLQHLKDGGKLEDVFGPQKKKIKKSSDKKTKKKPKKKK